MRSLQTLLAVVAVAGLSWVTGCTSDSNDHHYRSSSSSRSYDPYYGTSRSTDYRTTRSYDPYDSASTAGYDHRPWRDDSGRLHHDADWKADSDRGRLSNDRDDRHDRYDNGY
jgi:hypothetical protein